MKNRQRDFSIQLDSDALFVRADLEKLSQKKHLWNSARHCNAEYELHIILQGVSQVDVEDRHFSLRQQQAILIAPGQYHLPRSLPGEFERFSLSFSLSDGQLLAAMRRQIPVCRVFAVPPEVEALCHSLFREHTFKSPFWLDMQPCLLTQLIISTFRLLHLDVTAHPVLADAKESVRTDLIDEYFENSFSKDARLSELAQILHLSRRQVARVLQENYGMGFQKKLICTRMDHAAWLLRTTDKHTAQIAGAVGYVSEAAFYQAFRTQFHVTPQQYRRQFLTSPHEDA